MRNASREIKFLDQYFTTFDNIQKMPEISQQLALFGYGTEKTEEGRTLFNKTKKQWKNNLDSHIRLTESTRIYSTTLKEMREIFKKQKMRAKNLFAHDEQTVDLLRLKGNTPRQYASLVQVMTNFYTCTLNNPTLLESLLVVQLTKEILSDSKEMVLQVQNNHSQYLKDKAESEQETVRKNSAMKELKNWMSNFYSRAKIALEEKPQLMEAFDQKQG